MPPEPKYGTNQWFEWQYKGTDPGSDPWGGTIRAGLQLRLDEYAEFIQTQIGEDHFHSLQRFLDVGCALGDFSARLAIGKRSGLKLAGGNLDFCVLSLPNLPLPKNTFDFLSCISVLYYPQNDERIQFLLELERVLKPGGYIFLEVPIGSLPFLSPKSFIELFSRRFEILGTAYFYGKYFLKAESFLFRIFRKANKLGKQSGSTGKLWRITATVLEKLIQMPILANLIIKFWSILKCGASHVYILGRKKYES
jgi:SAM-dependent methyltransferase